jgi:hypothetical protein
MGNARSRTVKVKPLSGARKAPRPEQSVMETSDLTTHEIWFLKALLVDIVVTDKNLHAVFLFSPTVDRPNNQGGWTTGARICANIPYSQLVSRY